MEKVLLVDTDEFQVTLEISEVTVKTHNATVDFQMQNQNTTLEVIHEMSKVVLQFVAKKKISKVNYKKALSAFALSIFFIAKSCGFKKMLLSPKVIITPAVSYILNELKGYQIKVVSKC